jgi:hypothetical protein
MREGITHGHLSDLSLTEKVREVNAWTGLSRVYDDAWHFIRAVMCEGPCSLLWLMLVCLCLHLCPMQC